MTSPAETLRAFATLIRETASNATPGPWRVSRIPGIGRTVNDPTARLSIAVGTGWVSGADGEWIALAGPQIAEHLFAWLYDAANDMAGAEVVGSKLPDAADPIEYCDEPDSVRAALAFARAILGRTS